MKTDAAIGAIIVTITALIAGLEAGIVQGKFAALLLAAGVVTAFLFSVMKNLGKGRLVAADYEGQDVIDVEGLGVKVKARNLGRENTLMLILVVALAALGYKHHTANEEALGKLFDAIAENTYVLSLNQADRERLQIAVPESLKRKMRDRDRDR